MVSDAPRRIGGRLDQVAWVARLATGAPPAPGPVSWDGILECAIQERCAALAWLRSGDFIRRTAPAAEVARWRAVAVANDETVRLQSSLLAEVLGALERQSVGCIVLKGIPLSAQLYGDLSARTTDDIDLYVAPTDRSAARAALLAAGWRAHYSESVLDDCYTCERDGRDHYLEVHTALVSDIFSHTGLPLQTESRVLPFGVARVLGGPVLPVYLAAHLAKHPLPYLLWSVDFAALWTGLAAHEREAAFRVAREVRLCRWLRWAVARVELLARACEGDAPSLAALGFAEDGRRVTHGPGAFLSNADSPIDAARVFRQLVWPSRLRGDLPGFVALSAERVRGRFARLGATPRARSA